MIHRVEKRYEILGKLSYMVLGRVVSDKLFGLVDRRFDIILDVYYRWNIYDDLKKNCRKGKE
jgi:hypothetical protein